MRIFRTTIGTKSVDVDIDQADVYAKHNAHNAFEVAARMRLRLDKLVSPYEAENPEWETVEVSTVEAVLVDGKVSVMVDRPRKVNVQKPRAELDSDTFNRLQQAQLDYLPPEFQSWASQSAWERGHSSGYEEVLNILTCLVGELEPCIRRFADRIKEKK